MIYCVNAALLQMERGARIVNTASVTAYTGSPSLIDHAASQGAVLAFTRPLALALGDRGIRVNAVVREALPAASAASPAVRRANGTRLSMRDPELDDIVRCCLFLATEASRNITG